MNSTLKLLACSASLALVLGASGRSAAQASSQDSQSRDSFSTAPPTQLSYDKEYPVMHYDRKPAHNAIARLQAQLDRGEVKLSFVPGRGYLVSLLKALGIDPSSQSLVYSKTSLQVGSISAATPRALYFDTDTYVGYVQHSTVLELAAMDSVLGQVFYTLDNQPAAAAHFTRETLRCLSCHDTYELSGGGVPRFLLMSSYVNVRGEQLTHEGSILTTDETPLQSRWGGWYVSGYTGKQVNVGNILVDNVQQLVNLVKLGTLHRGSIPNLDGLLDTKPYLTDKSDVVALLVLQHQETVQNLITRVNFEVRTALARAAKGRNESGNKSGIGSESSAQEGAALPPKTTAALKQYLDDLTDAMLFVDAAKITDTIRGTSGFDAWFQNQGPRDPAGRSLRDLDLKTRLFKYPLSYLVYTPAFDGLPDYALDYIYGRFAAVLQGRDPGENSANLTPQERQDILEILTTTKPAFARFLAAHPQG